MLMISICINSVFLVLSIFKRKVRRQSPVVNQRAVQADKAGVGSVFANTSGFFSNAVVGQAVDDRRSSWLKRIGFGRKSVNPEKELFEQNEGVTGKKKLRKFSMKRNSTEIEGSCPRNYVYTVD